MSQNFPQRLNQRAYLKTERVTSSSLRSITVPGGIDVYNAYVTDKDSSGVLTQSDFFTRKATEEDTINIEINGTKAINTILKDSPITDVILGGSIGPINPERVDGFFYLSSGFDSGRTDLRKIYKVNQTNFFITRTYDLESVLDSMYEVTVQDNRVFLMGISTDESNIKLFELDIVNGTLTHKTFSNGITLSSSFITTPLGSFNGNLYFQQYNTNAKTNSGYKYNLTTELTSSFTAANIVTFGIGSFPTRITLFDVLSGANAFRNYSMDYIPDVSNDKIYLTRTTNPSTFSLASYDFGTNTLSTITSTLDPFSDVLFGIRYIYYSTPGLEDSTIHVYDTQTDTSSSFTTSVIRPVLSISGDTVIVNPSDPATPPASHFALSPSRFYDNQGNFIIEEIKIISFEYLHGTNGSLNNVTGEGLIEIDNDLLTPTFSITGDNPEIIIGWVE